MNQYQNHMSQPMLRLRFLLHQQAGKAQMRLNICAATSEPMLFAYINYLSEGRPRIKLRPLVPLDI